MGKYAYSDALYTTLPTLFNKSPESNAVVVTGESGSGKTTLLLTFTRWLASKVRGIKEADLRASTSTVYLVRADHKPGTNNVLSDAKPDSAQFHPVPASKINEVDDLRKLLNPKEGVKPQFVETVESSCRAFELYWMCTNDTERFKTFVGSLEQRPRPEVAQQPTEIVQPNPRRSHNARLYAKNANSLATLLQDVRRGRR